MDLKFLDFEQPIAELEAKIDELRFVGDDSEIRKPTEIFPGSLWVTVGSVCNCTRCHRLARLEDRSIDLLFDIVAAECVLEGGWPVGGI